MIDASNHWPDNTERLNFFDPNLEDLEKQFDTGGKPVVKVPVELKKGQVSFHHCLTIHGSGPNLGDAPRRSIAVHLQDGTNSYNTTPRRGKPASHGNDEFVGRTADGHPDYRDPVACPALYRA